MIGFNPCGMVMDFLRSGYSTSCQFVAGRVSTIRWYRCLDTALPFPDHHSFGSLNRQPAKGYLNAAIGEQLPASRPWSNSNNTGAPPGTGYWGSLADFQDGGKLTLLPIPINTEGYPAICRGILPVQTAQMDVQVQWTD